MDRIGIGGLYLASNLHATDNTSHFSHLTQQFTIHIKLIQNKVQNNDSHTGMGVTEKKSWAANIAFKILLLKYQYTANKYYQISTDTSPIPSIQITARHYLNFKWTNIT